jgi:hypothetical protein
MPFLAVTVIGMCTGKMLLVIKIHFQIFWLVSRHCKMHLLPSSGLSICLDQPGSQWMDFHEIWYRRHLLKIIKSWKKSKFGYNHTNRASTLTESFSHSEMVLGCYNSCSGMNITKHFWLTTVLERTTCHISMAACSIFYSDGSDK